MLKAHEILKTDKHTQLKWLRNQMSKNNVCIFVNPDIGLPLFNDLVNFNTPKGLIKRENHEIAMREVTDFVARCLTVTATKKLVNTLRVTASRLGKKSLQTPLSHEAEKMLNYMVSQSSVTKVELLNQMIEYAFENGFTAKKHR